MKLRSLIPCLLGSFASLCATRADTVNWANITYAPTPAGSTQATTVQTVNGVSTSVLFSNSAYESTFVQSPASGSYAATTAGNTNAVYSNGGTVGNYGLQLVANFSTSTSANASGTFIGGASTTVTIAFSKPVLNVSFQFYDIDSGTLSGGVYTDYVSNIFGIGTGGATVAPITLAHGTDNMLNSTGSIVTTGFVGNASSAQNSGDGNATVAFDPGTAITQFSYTYGDTAANGSTHSPLQIIALGNVNYTVPEPSTWALLAVGLAAGGAGLRRPRHASARA